MGTNRYFIGIFAALAALAAPARAGDLTVVLRDENGAAIADAVIMLAAAAPADDHASRTLVVDQKGERFMSLVSLIRPGDSVRFQNSDPVLHHVYSFAPINPFDMLVRPDETTPETLYAEAGLAAIGCNVHDDMLTYVFVADMPFAAKTGADGRAKILGAPEGAADITVWHPRIKKRSQKETFPIVVSEGEETLEYAIALRPERRRAPSRY